MKRILTLLLLPVFILTSCSPGGGSAADSEEITKIYSNAANIQARAKVNALASDGASFEFVLDYALDSQSESVTVSEPAEISGIVIPLKDGVPFLSEKDVSVEDGLFPEYGFSSVNVIPKIFHALSKEIVSDTSEEKIDQTPCTVLTYTDNGDKGQYIKRIWLENTGAKPLKACVYSDGTLILECDFLLCDIS